MWSNAFFVLAVIGVALLVGIVLWEFINNVRNKHSVHK